MSSPDICAAASIFALLLIVKLSNSSKFHEAAHEYVQRPEPFKA
jgi:hypothetical protein